MKKISSKIVAIFILILVNLFVTVIASVVAVDTQQQHIAITEIVADQRINIGQVVNLTDTMARVYVASGDIPTEINAFKTKVINSTDHIDLIIDNLYQKNYKLIDGSDYKLKFRGDFERDVFANLDQFSQKWIDMKAQTVFLLDSSNMNDLEKYKSVYQSFNDTNNNLVGLSDEFIMLCLAEANAKRTLSLLAQVVSVLSALVILFVLIQLILKGFYRPFIEIKENFRLMGEGTLQVFFKRDKEDEFKEIYAAFNHFIDSLNFIFTLEDKILAENNIKRILEYIFNNFKSYVPFENIMLEYQSKSIIKQLVTTDSGIVEQISEQILTESDQQCKEHSICIPISVEENELGHVYFLFSEATTITDSHRNFIALLKQKLTVAFYKSILITDLLSIVTNSLANLAETKDPETGQHLKRMSLYSQVIASKLKNVDQYKAIVNDDYVKNIGYAAPMHDIGKVAIKDEILLKPGKLTDDEFAIMKTHAEAGGHVLDAIDRDMTRFDITYFKMASEIAWGHHEKYDGTGYPYGLKKEDIPLAARICAIADVFDALSTKRPYKEPFELAKCYEILKEGSGKHFDPELLAIFFEQRSEIEKIYNHNRE